MSHHCHQHVHRCPIHPDAIPGLWRLYRLACIAGWHSDMCRGRRDHLHSCPRDHAVRYPQWRPHHVKLVERAREATERWDDLLP